MWSLDKIVYLLEYYRYLLLFPIATFEGPIISVISGFLASKGYFSLAGVCIVVIIADLTGDTIYYAIGRYGGRAFIRKWGKYFGINDEKIFGIENHFKDHAGKTLLFSKTQAIGSVILASAGLSKMPYKKFIWFNLLGTAVKSTLLVFIGFYFGRLYNSLNTYLNYAALVFFIIGAIVVRHFFKHRKPQL